jgi:hypothetical protein
LDSPTADGVVDIYLGEWPSEEIGNAAKEFQDLLSCVHSEDELKQLMREFGCYYNPLADGLSYHQWLTKVYELLKSRR